MTTYSPEEIEMIVDVRRGLRSGEARGWRGDVPAAQFAQLAAVKAGDVPKYERGERIPRPATALRLAAAYATANMIVRRAS
jgi:hypothetical protein